MLHRSIALDGCVPASRGIRSPRVSHAGNDSARSGAAALNTRMSYGPGHECTAGVASRKQHQQLMATRTTYGQLMLPMAHVSAGQVTRNLRRAPAKVQTPADRSS